MKIFSLVLFSFFTFAVFAEAIPSGWIADVARARRHAADEKKPILLVISGPSADKASKALKKDVIDNDDFNSAIKKNAVCLIAYTQSGKKKEKREEELKKTFSAVYKGKVPCAAVLDSKLKLLSVPAGNTAYDLVKAVSDVLVKNGGKEIPELKKLKKEYDEEQRKKDKKSRKDKNKKDKKSSRKTDEEL